MSLNLRDLHHLERAADAAEAQVELVRMTRARRSPARFAGPIAVAIGLVAAVAALSVSGFVPDRQGSVTYLSQSRVPEAPSG
jgi:hypothetical protein